MRAGKNTLATMLVKHLGLNEQDAKIVALADPIKRMVLEMVPNARKDCLFGPSELRSEIINDMLKDKAGKPLSYRQLLIDLGTLGRAYCKNVWLNALIQDAKLSTDKRAYIISDVRFSNELEYLKSNNFYMIRIKRNEGPKIDDVSETEQLKIPDDVFHSVIDNNGTLEKLDLSAKETILKVHNFAYV